MKSMFLVGVLLLATFSPIEAIAEGNFHVGQKITTRAQVCDTLEQVLDVMKVNVEQGFEAGLARYMELNRAPSPIDTGACGLTPLLPITIVSLITKIEGAHKADGTTHTLYVIEVSVPDGTHYFGAVTSPIDPKPSAFNYNGEDQGI